MNARANPKDTDAFARVALIVSRFRDMRAGDVFAAVATDDGGAAKLTYGDLRQLMVSALDAGDRLQRIAAWHAREEGDGGLVGQFCIECGHHWPCDTRKMATGSYVDPEVVYDHEHPCPTDTMCRDDLRKRGYDPPDDLQCCVCWKQAHAPELLTGRAPG